MADRPTVVIAFKDIAADEEIKESIERRCAHLGQEFHELSRVEITLSEEAAGYSVHAHATSKARDLGAAAEASELAPAADSVLDKLERQLRTAHDKRIFTQRREAQRHPPKKRATTP